jgi:protein SCO1/2
MSDSPTTRSGGKKAAFVLAALLAMAAGIVISLQWPRAPGVASPKASAVRVATVLPQFRELPPFALGDHLGGPFSNQELMGKWTFLSFGYTHCPDICPTTLAILGSMDEEIAASGPSAPRRVVFVSIDPERDSQQRLAEYIGYFDPQFVAATGSDAELQGLTRPLGILYAKVPTENSAMGYVMDHSASVILVDPKGRYHALFSPPHDPLAMAADFNAIVSNYGD